MNDENSPQDTGQTPGDSTQPPKPTGTNVPIIEPEFDVITESQDPPGETREEG